MVAAPARALLLQPQPCRPGGCSQFYEPGSKVSPGRAPNTEAQRWGPCAPSGPSAGCPHTPVINQPTGIAAAGALDVHQVPGRRRAAAAADVAPAQFGRSAHRPEAAPPHLGPHAHGLPAAHALAQRCIPTALHALVGPLLAVLTPASLACRGGVRYEGGPASVHQCDPGRPGAAGRRARRLFPHTGVLAPAKVSSQHTFKDEARRAQHILQQPRQHAVTVLAA